MKVVINRDEYGYFNLSYKAIIKYAEAKKDKLGGIDIRAYLWDLNLDTIKGYNGEKITDKLTFCVVYSERPVGNINEYHKHKFLVENIKRNDPDLVRVVEELGSESFGPCCNNLEIIEIPDDVDWYIEAYSGWEFVAEKHRTWGE